MNAAAFDAEARAIRRAAIEYQMAERKQIREEWERHLSRVLPAQHAALKEQGATNVDWIDFPLEQRRTERWRVDGHLVRVIYTMDAIVCVPTEATATDRCDWRADLGGVILD